MSTIKSRVEFVSYTQREMLDKMVRDKVPRSHTTIEKACGVARPGKTRQDKSRGVWSTQHSKHGTPQVEKKKGR